MPKHGANEAKDAEIEHLLEMIPEEDQSPATPGRRAPAAVDVHAMVQAVRRDVASTLQAELDRVEKTFASHLQEMERRIQLADAELARLASERERLAQENAAHERRWRAIREMAGGADKP